MTGDLRIIQTGAGPVVPIVDIAAGIGYTRSAISKMIKRYPEAFNGLSVIQPVETGNRGVQHMICLTREGVDQLLVRLEPASTTKPELREKVQALKERAFSSRPAALPAPQPVTSPLIDSLNRNADIADILVDRYNYQPEVARSLAMAAVVEECGESALVFKGPAMLPAPKAEETVPALPATTCSQCIMSEADPDFEKFFSLRKVAEYTGLQEDRARNILEKTGLLHWEHGIWHLTQVGKQFGKVFTTYPLAPHRMTEKKMIRWSPEAIERVKAYVSAGQSQLVEPTSG